MNAAIEVVYDDLPFTDALCFPRSPQREPSQQALVELVQPDSLSVMFQPIVRLGSAEVFGYEALTRCSSPALGNPEELFEQARATGCSGRLGRMARELAIRHGAGVPVFINVHPRELEERWLVRPDDPIFQHDRTVCLELTESTPLGQVDLCRSVLRELRQRGGASAGDR